MDAVITENNAHKCVHQSVWNPLFHILCSLCGISTGASASRAPSVNGIFLHEQERSANGRGPCNRHLSECHPLINGNT